MGGRRKRRDYHEAKGPRPKKLRNPFLGVSRTIPSVSSEEATLSKYRPSRQWIEACGSVVQMIKQVLMHTMGSNWSVIPQGSFVQGLQLSGSDLDLVLLDGSERWRNLNRNKTADELESVVRRLTRAQWEGFPLRINVIRKIYRARVPLARLRVTLMSSNLQVEVDMCFGDPSRGLCDQFVHRVVSRISQLENFCLAMKIWANRRGLTETHTGGISCFAIVLLSMFYYRQSGLSWTQFFEFLISLRHKPKLSVSVESQQLVSRPLDGERDLLHVAVPCRPNENAARCLTLSVWVNKVLPELRRAAAICSKADKDKVSDFDYMVTELLEKRNVQITQFDVSEDESSLASQAEDGEIEIIESPPIRDHIELSGDSERSASSVDSEDIISWSNNTRKVTDVAPLHNSGTPIAIHECDKCNYFSFRNTDLQNHYFAVHQYPGMSTGEEKESSQYKMPRRSKNLWQHL